MYVVRFPVCNDNSGTKCAWRNYLTVKQHRFFTLRYFFPFLGNQKGDPHPPELSSFLNVSSLSFSLRLYFPLSYTLCGTLPCLLSVYVIRRADVATWSPLLSLSEARTKGRDRYLSLFSENVTPTLLRSVDERKYHCENT